MKKKENKIIISVDPKLYSLEAVYGAAYAFLDKAYIYLEEGSKSKIQVSLKGKEKLTKKSLETLKGEFLNELLNFSLRDKISKSNRKIREYIIGRALASALPNSGKLMEKKEETLRRKPLDKADAWDKETLTEEFEKALSREKDPEGIAVPWEEKHLCLDKKSSKQEKEEFIKEPDWGKESEEIVIPWKKKDQKQEKCKKNKKKKSTKKNIKKN